MFDTLIVQPIFNLLVLIYNLIPGHNFGLAVIIFTILVRLMLWPLVKRQLHQTKLIRKLQPELKEIKKKAKGDRALESQMMMELYKERGVSLFASFKVILLQLPILFGLYLGLTKIVKDPNQLVDFSYPWIQDFSWMQEVARDISKFDETLFGLVDLTRPALSSGDVYWPALLLVLGSAVIQFYQSKQLLPQDKDARSLRQILKDAGDGKQADQSEVNAAVGKGTIYLFPALVVLFTIQLASALSLYWLVGGIVAFIQQTIALRDDVDEMETVASKKPLSNKSTKAATGRPAKEKPKVIEGEVVAKTETVESSLKKDPNRRRQGAKVKARKG